MSIPLEERCFTCRFHLAIPLERQHPKNRVADAAWSQFLACVAYKAESAGRKFAQVNPAYTSQTCSACGARKKLTLAQRTYRCEVCGLKLNRDLNAAKNILRVGLHSLGGAAIAPALEAAGL